MDENPVAGSDSGAVCIQQTDVHVPTYTGDVDLRQPVLVIDDLDDLTRYR
jgi:hypothetical protein